MSIRSTFGIDGFDLFVHAAATVAAIVVLGPGMDGDPGVVLGGVPVVSLLVLAVRRHFGLKNLPPETTSEVAAERIYQLEERMADLEAMQFRVQELEERVDFAERLLSRAPPNPEQKQLS